MLEIGKTLVSLDVISKKFCCDLPACLGSCCVYGDSGAPLTKAEAEVLEASYSIIEPYIQENGRKTIKVLGTHIVDSDGDTVTPLIDEKECAYTVFENGIALCGIENCCRDGKIELLKPLSCHLYPVRITKYKSFDAVNFESWDICKPAEFKGENLDLPVYVFVKAALLRAYGQEWYDQLDYAAKNDVPSQY